MSTTPARTSTAEQNPRRRRRRSRRRRNPGKQGKVAGLVIVSAIAGAGISYLVTKMMTKTGSFSGYHYKVMPVTDSSEIEWGVTSPDGRAIAGGRANDIATAFNAIGATLSASLEA